MHSFTCVRCGATAKQHRNVNDICKPCAAARVEESKVATRAVVRLIKSGRMKKAREHVCIDCGRPALDYDHRDYLKPLEVQPVCRACNQRRGPAYDSLYRPRAEQLQAA